MVYPNLQQGRKRRLIHNDARRLSGLAISITLSRVRTSSLWRDPIGLLAIVLAIATNLAVYAYIWSHVDRLPPFLPLHYNSAGEVDLIGRPVELFRMPIIGTIVWLGNAFIGAFFHHDDFLAARLLVVAGVTAQILLFGATIGIIARAFG